MNVLLVSVHVITNVKILKVVTYVNVHLDICFMEVVNAKP